MDPKKIYIQFYSILAAVLFVIVAAIFIIRYLILKIPIIEESWIAEILKYLFGFFCLYVACGGIGFTPITMYIQRKKYKLED